MKVMTQDQVSSFIKNQYIGYAYDTTARYTVATQRAILETMLTDRLANYGYGLRDWRRIQQQRYRAREALREAIQFGLSLNWGDLNSRWSEKGDYTVGQSSNEEITNQIRALVGAGRKGWVS